MNYLKLIPVIFSLISLETYAQTPFNLDLKPKSGIECEPLDPNASNQFACCVKLAQTIESADGNTLHLKADPKLCLNPDLQDLKFDLMSTRPNGIKIYSLSSPSIEHTPFKSYSGNPTRFWLAINSSFEFPKKTYPSDGVHSFIVAPLRIEQTMPDNSTKVTFSTELSTVLGWKYLNQQIVSEKFESYDCSNRFEPHKTCTDRIRTYELNWLNQLTGDIFKQEVESRDTI